MKKLLLVIALVLATSPLFSQWSTDPFVNNTVTNKVGFQENVVTCPDGAGGIIMAWEDYSGGAPKIYAQKINVFGQTVWTFNGIGVCPAFGDQRSPSICSDAAGGAIIYWVDYREGGGFFNYYAQRVRTDGILMWDNNGIKVNNIHASGFYYQHKCISAEAGSSILAWNNYDPLERGLLSQKLDAFGHRAWDLGDVLIYPSTFYNFDLCYDGGKGAYYCYSIREIDLFHTDLYAQHVNALGFIQWTPHVAVCTEKDYQYNPSMCEDQTGGFIVAWEDYRSYFYTPGPLTQSSDIYAAHFNSSGTNLWTFNGLPVCTVGHDQFAPTCISDLHSGAHIIWTDLRFFGPSGANVYGQNISFNGIQRWTSNGLKIADRVDYSATNTGRFGPQIVCCDALGGAIVCWVGFFDPFLTQYGILAQKIDYYGVFQWNSNGIFVSSDIGKFGPSLIFDGGSGGCNVAWTDDRFGDHDIFAQHVKSNSFLGNNKPKPSIVKTDILAQNFPNPFNPTTNIAFTLANDANISIRIFDMSGRELEVLADGLMTAGDHSVTWNASNYASGTYFYKFTNGNNVEVKKMFLVK